MSYITEAMKILNACYGADVCHLMSDVASVREDPIATSLVALDWGLLGFGGFPNRYLTELAGDDKTGKTTMMQHLVAGCQAEDRVPIIIDPSGTMATDIERNKRIGVVPEQAPIVNINTSDEALKGTRVAFRTFMKKDIPVMLFWDDAGLTPSDAEMNPGVDKKTKKEKKKPGSNAKAMWEFCRSLIGPAYKAGVPMVISNQLTSLIHTAWVPTGTPTEASQGGRGIKYAPRVRIILRTGKKLIKGSGPKAKTFGKVITAETIANAFFSPHRKVKLWLDFKDGFNSDMSTLLTAEALGFVKVERGRYKLSSLGRKGKYQKLESFLEENTWSLEEEMWPWMRDDYVGEDPGSDEIEDVDDDEEEDDEFAEGYIDEG